MEDEQRLFPQIDPEMMSFASTYRSLTARYLAQFEAFDPQLDAAFLNDWELAIRAAYGMQNDETTMDIMQQMTRAVDICHDACMEAMRDLRYYASKAFAKGSSSWAYLNFKGLNRARQSTSRTVVYVLAVHRVATTLSGELTAKGMLPAQIDALSTTAMALLQADIDQEHYKHERLMLTRKRVETLNHLWSFCQLINRASKTVFSQSYEETKMFELK